MTGCAVTQELRKPFFGRRAEIAALVQALEDVVAGHGRAVTLAGEPGIGKTRLAEEFARLARARGVQVLMGCCYEGEGAPPLWPWIQVVRGCCIGPIAEGLRTLEPLHAAVIASVAPEVAQCFSKLPAVPELEPASARFRFFDAVGQMLRAIAQHRSVLLVIEDLHWSDAASMLLLKLLVSQSGHAPLMVLATYRDTELHRAALPRRHIGDLERLPRVQRMALAGLSEAECRELIHSLAATRLDAGGVSAIWEESRGNPFFVQALVRSVCERGAMQVERATAFSRALPVPEALREVIRAQLDGLSEATRALLHTASVIGRECSLALLARVGDAFGQARVTLADALDEAVRAGAIERVPQPGLVRFSHALIQEVLYEELRSSERVARHERIGRAMEELYAGDLDPHLSDLAHHFYGAALGGAADKALHYARRAAQRARHLAAFDEAAALLRNALQVLDLMELPLQRERCEVLIDLGEAEFLSGDARAADTHFANAANLARHLDEPELFGRAVFGMHGVWGTAGAADMEYVRLLEEALARLPEGDSELRICLMGRLAEAMGRRETAHAHLESALTMHGRMGARPLRAMTEYRLAELLVNTAAVEDRTRAMAILQSARDLAQPMGMKRIDQLAEQLGSRLGAAGEEEAAAKQPAIGVTPVTRLLRREGEFWTVGRPEQPLRLPRTKGLDYIAYLISRPNHDVLATDLAELGISAPAADATISAADSSMVFRRDLGDAGETLDRAARHAYKERLRNLRDELEEARRFNDIGRASKAQAEIESLTAELARGVGLGGRERRAASHLERARINVTRSIKKAIMQIGRYDRSLAHHLSASIHTGRFCCYRPDPEHTIHWQL